jgi:hypothetical protein
MAHLFLTMFATSLTLFSEVERYQWRKTFSNLLTHPTQDDETFCTHIRFLQIVSPDEQFGKKILHFQGVCALLIRRVLDSMVGFIDTLFTHLGTTGDTELLLLYTLSVHCCTRIRVLSLH